MAVTLRVLKDDNNDTIDVSLSNLGTLKSTYIDPLSSKLTKVLYNTETGVTTVDGPLSITGALSVYGHSGSVLFSGDVDASSNASSTNPLQNKTIVATYATKSTTVAGLPLSSDIGVSALAGALAEKMTEEQFLVTDVVLDDPVTVEA